MTQQFEDFVNAALDKSLASDVTLPTANKIPVYTGIGRQVTGKTPDELGLAVLVDGVVPANQLPSYVDDVLEFANLASFPVTGESGKVYVAIDTKKTYRWSGSTYVQIGSDLALGDTISTAYRGDRGKTAYDHSQATGNPHGATTANINDSADRRYVTDAKLTVLNNTSGTNSGDETANGIRTKIGAASGTNDGYLSSTDWSTFNSKQAALADVITSNTYGNSTQWPIVTVNAKGIVTGIELQTVSVAEVSDSVFRIVDNSDATKKLAFEASGIGTGQTKTITMPNADINLGELPSVATTNGNSISGTAVRCRILGGQDNTVSGTNNIGVNSTNCTIDTGNYNTAIRSENLTIQGNYCTSIGSVGGEILGEYVHSSYCTNLTTTATLRRVSFHNVEANQISSSSMTFAENTEVVGSSAGVLTARCAIKGNSIGGVGSVLTSINYPTYNGKPLLCINGGLSLMLATHKCVLFARRSDGTYSDYLILRFVVNVSIRGGTPIITTSTESVVNPTGLSYSFTATKASGTYEMDLKCDIAGTDDYLVFCYVDSTYLTQT